MICISISQESRRLALADMLNASRQCDLIELQLDRFGKAPDIGEILAVKPKPIILSCRRSQDGGSWQGTESERLAILRQCIVSKADYVEIEVDVADQIRPFPPTKRVISYTNLRETPDNLAAIYEEARTKRPDVIKLVTLARTPEEAWPLVQLLGRPALPTVVVGLGKPSVMLNILGKKIGAPWTYAALEHGMEAYPGQPTIHDLEQVYHYRAISLTTRLVGVTGFSTTAFATIAGLNAAFAHLGLNVRCLPLAVGGIELFRKVIEAVRLVGVVVEDQHRDLVGPLATERESAAYQAQTVDLILRKGDKWHGYNTVGRAAVAALEKALQAKTPGDRPLAGRMVVIVGTNPTARAVAHAVKKREGLPILAGRDRNATAALAQTLGCRGIPMEAVYSTMHDVLIVCSEEKEKPPPKVRAEEAGLRAGYLKPTITVMDLTALPQKTSLLYEAQARGCPVVSPRHVLLNQLDLQVRLLTSKEVPRERLEEATLVAVSDED